MGNQPSVPRPGTEYQVIGAGLPRSGTASFSEALRILLDGPVYHGGTQVTLAPDVEIRSWTNLLSHLPVRSAADEKVVHDIIRQRLDGYAASTDAPTCTMVKELLEVYPNAKVICTVRDPKAWEKSMAGITTAATRGFLRVLLFPLPTMRYFVPYIDGSRALWATMYDEHEPHTAVTFNRHNEMLKKIVPADGLFFFDVREGWEPLCKALGKPVPKDIPFPKLNDGEAIERLSKQFTQRGLIRWLIILATGGLALIPFYVMNI